MTTTIETGALARALRTLKRGMLDTIDARLAQARAGELGHVDVLQVLCEDEITRRPARPSTGGCARPGSKNRSLWKAFDFAAAPKLPAAQIRDLAALRWLHAGESVILDLHSLDLPPRDFWGGLGVAKPADDRLSSQAQRALGVPALFTQLRVAVV